MTVFWLHCFIVKKYKSFFRVFISSRNYICYETFVIKINFCFTITTPFSRTNILWFYFERATRHTFRNITSNFHSVIYQTIIRKTINSTEFAHNLIFFFQATISLFTFFTDFITRMNNHSSVFEYRITIETGKTKILFV